MLFFDRYHPVYFHSLSPIKMLCILRLFCILQYILIPKVKGVALANDWKQWNFPGFLSIVERSIIDILLATLRRTVLEHTLQVQRLTCIARYFNLSIVYQFFLPIIRLVHSYICWLNPWHCKRVLHSFIFVGYSTHLILTRRIH